MASHDSGKLFTLANDYGIPEETGPLEDEAFLGFRERYLQWSEQRDEALSGYLSASPNLFRAHIPAVPRMMLLASSVVWYFDEIVIYDPIAHVLRPEEDNLVKQKYRLRDNYRAVSFFRNAIEGGFILFAGPTKFPQLPDPEQDFVATILQDQSIIKGLKAEVRFGCTEWTNEIGANAIVYHMMLDSGRRICAFTQTIPPQTTMEIPIWRVGETVPPISRRELAAKLGRDPFESGALDQLFALEVRGILRTARRARDFGAAALFDRDVAETVLSRTDGLLDESRQGATARVLDLTLPYVQGIPTERLSALRSQIPMAFQDFRGRMVEILRDAVAQGVTDAAEMRTRVERKVVPELRSLEGEMKSALQKGGILQLGLPLVFGVAGLAGFCMGAPFWAAVGLWATGAAGAVKATADKEAAQQKIATHPFYFLWKATHTKQQ